MLQKSSHFNSLSLSLSLSHIFGCQYFFFRSHGRGWVCKKLSFIQMSTSEHHLSNFLTKETSIQYKGNESSLLKLAGVGIRNIKETNPANVLRHRTGRQCLQVCTQYRLTTSCVPPTGSATASLTVSISQTSLCEDGHCNTTHWACARSPHFTSV